MSRLEAATSTVAESIRQLRRRASFTWPALALLTVLFASLGAAAALLAPSTSNVAVTGGPLQLEVVRPSVAGIEWSSRAVMPEHWQAIGLSGLILTTTAFLGLLALAALMGFFGVRTEESARRRSGVAIRRAVGASRRQLLEEHVIETLVLASTAAAVAVLITMLLRMLVEVSWPGTTQLPSPSFLAISCATVLLGSALATVARALAFSLEARPGGVLNVNLPLPDAAPTKPVHPLLSVLQVSSVVAVLTTAILLLGSERPDSRAGFLPIEDVQRIQLRQMSGAANGTAEAGVSSLISAAENLPGSSRAAFVSNGAALGLGVADHVVTECGNCFAGDLPMPMKGGPVVHHLATADTFRMLGMAVVRGRGFRPSDASAGAAVALVSEGFARRNFERGDPIGRRIKVGDTLDRWYTVIGVVQDATRWVIGASEQPAGEVYLSAIQHDVRRGDLLLSGPADPSTLGTALKQAGWEVREAGSLGAYLAEQERAITWFARACWTLSLVALFVDMFGIFSTTRLQVRQEIPEIGIRRALGARRRSILLRYLGASLKRGSAGIVGGLWLSLFALPHLPAVPTLELTLLQWVLLGVAFPVLLAVVLGALSPAWRASRIPPHEAIVG